MGRLSVHLADFFAHATPADHQAMRATLGRHLSPAWADQAAAAHADATRAAAGTCDWKSPPRSGEVATKDIPDWLRLLVVEAHTRYAVGKATTCIHDPHPSRPQPIVAAAWRPGLVACISCIHHFSLSGPEAFRCDSCGADDPELYAGRIIFGALLFMYGVCRGCFTDLPPHQAPGRAA